MTEHGHIADVTVGALMTRPVLSIRLDTTIAAVTALMAAHPFNGFPVVDELGALHGLVTRLDLFKCCLVPESRFLAAVEDSWAASVRAIMTRHPLVVRPFEPAARAIQLVVDHRLRTIPVVEESGGVARLVGVVTRSDLARALVR